MIDIDFASKEGKRSSQASGRAILSQAVATTDGSIAHAISSTRDWRKDYIAHFGAVVAAGARSTKNAIAIAENGLAAVQEQVVARTPDGDVPVRSTLRDGTGFDTDIVEGAGGRATEVALPYRGAELRGDGLRRRVDAWVAAGTIEPSTAEAIRRVVANPGWLDLSDHTIALLGAASEMGPLEHVCAWGATVVAVDLPRPHLWERVDSAARAGGGRVLRPTREGRPGADLLTQLADVRAWMDRIDAPLVLGNYVYAPGADFVRLTTAVDALAGDLIDSGRAEAYAYLATPTDVYAVPEDIAQDARRRREATLSSHVLRRLTLSALYAPHYKRLVEGDDGRRWGIADALVPIQGANYALAKQIQRWRAVAARDSDVPTSANVAPATRTASVTNNRMLAAAYRGAPRYGVEVFEPATSRALMALLLVHDLRNEQAAANPGSQLDHPYDLFVDQAAHGGLWRMAYEPRSVLPLALARGSIARRR